MLAKLLCGISVPRVCTAAADFWTYKSTFAMFAVSYAAAAISQSPRAMRRGTEACDASHTATASTAGIHGGSCLVCGAEQTKNISPTLPGLPGRALCVLSGWLDCFVCRTSVPFLSSSTPPGVATSCGPSPRVSVPKRNLMKRLIHFFSPCEMWKGVLQLKRVRTAWR
jgi:hypothetical protein